MVEREHFLAGGGELGALMRARDWQVSPAGPPAAWPSAIKTAVSICLDSLVPIIVWIGTTADELVQLYNDAYRPVMGAEKHPSGLGERGCENWPEIWHVMGPIFTEVLTTGRAVRREDQPMVVHRNGYAEDTWFTHSHSPIRDENGQIVGVFTVVTETTERHRAEHALREANAQLEQRVADVLAERKILADIVDRTDALVQVADLDFGWLAINIAASKEFARIFGVRAPRAGDNMLAMLASKPEHQAAVQRAWARALAGEEYVEVEEFGDVANDRRAYEMHFRPLHDAAGRLFGAYQFVYDVTDRIQQQARLQAAEAALHQSQKMEAMGQLTGGIAHDFNNLLQAVTGSLDLIQRSPTDADRVRRMAEVGLRAAERGARLTAQLLAFSRAQKLELRPVALSKLVGGFREVLRRTLGPSINIELLLSTDEVHILGDEVQIELAILNLSLNARDAMRDGGKLTITSRVIHIIGDPDVKDGDYVELAVTDTGHGMPSDVAKRVFEPFFTTKGVGKGTGLGLSQVYGMARQAGGTVRLESGPGTGTTVRLWFQTTAADTPAQLAPQAARATGRGSGNVLVVDDEVDVRRLICESLASLGYVAIEAANGDAAIAALEATRPDFVILDFAMPGANGAEVARRLRLRIPNLPILFATGFSDSAAIEEAEASPHVLRKPFGIDELRAAVLAVLSDAH